MKSTKTLRWSRLAPSFKEKPTILKKKHLSHIFQISQHSMGHLTYPFIKVCKINATVSQEAENPLIARPESAALSAFQDLDILPIVGSIHPTVCHSRNVQCSLFSSYPLKTRKPGEYYPPSNITSPRSILGVFITQSSASGEMSRNQHPQNWHLLCSLKCKASLGLGIILNSPTCAQVTFILQKAKQVNMSACAPVEEIRFLLMTPTRTAVNFGLSDEKV